MLSKERLKTLARRLLCEQTDAEALLWLHIRKRKIYGVQFYRQKTICQYSVDFYAPSVKLVLELDGGQHFEEKHRQQDKKRDIELSKLNLKVMRFSNFDVMTAINLVVDLIGVEV